LLRPLQYTPEALQAGPGRLGCMSLDRVSRGACARAGGCCLCLAFCIALAAVVVSTWLVQGAVR
jgi:hypothetical protein